MSNTMKVKSYELKICEMCTVFWLRPAGRDWRYCPRCVHAIKDISIAHPELSTNRKRGWRKRKEAA